MKTSTILISLFAIIATTVVLGTAAAAQSTDSESLRGLGFSWYPDDSHVQQKAATPFSDTCTVMGSKINGKGIKYTYEERSLRFCCATCVDNFKKDPSNYLGKAKDQGEKRASGREGNADIKWPGEAFKK